MSLPRLSIPSLTLYHIKGIWGAYYHHDTYDVYVNDTSQREFDQVNCWIDNVLFDKINAQYVIDYKSATKRHDHLMISHSTFFSDAYGFEDSALIHVDQNSSVVQYRVCSVGDNYNTTHCDITASKDQFVLNFISESTFVRFNSHPRPILTMNFGWVDLSKVNLSHISGQAIVSDHTPKSCGALSYCCFENISSQTDSCFMLHEKNTKIDNCKFIKNYLVPTGKAMICINDKEIYMLCNIFTKNECPYLIYIDGYKTVTLTECYFDDTNKIKSRDLGRITYENQSAFILDFDMKCIGTRNAEWDLTDCVIVAPLNSGVLAALLS